MSSTSARGLKEATANLEDYFYIDTLDINQTGTVRLTVSLDGETQGNDYQDTFAKLQMRFAVEVPQTGTNTTTNRTTVVKTGDDYNINPFYIAMLISGLPFLYLALDAVTDRIYGRKGRTGTVLKRILPLCLVFCILSVLSFSAFADYGYTVRVYAGNQGAMVAVPTLRTMQTGMLLRLMRVLLVSTALRESVRAGKTIIHSLPMSLTLPVIRTMSWFMSLKTKLSLSLSTMSILRGMNLPPPVFTMAT